MQQVPLVENSERKPIEDIESTRDLLARVKGGDDAAHERVYRRFVPGLKRWASGRIPPQARGLVETEDIVQLSLIRALGQIERFDPRRPGAFLAYLHQILINCVRDEIRRASRRPSGDEIKDDLPDDRRAMLEETMGSNLVEVYERSLARLPENQQESIVLRVEFGFTYREISEALGRPSPNAVRMEITRGLARLAEVMNEET